QRDLLDLGRTVLLQVKERELQANERGVVGDLLICKLIQHLLEGCDRVRPPAKARVDLTLNPQDTEEVEPVGEPDRELAHLGDQSLSFCKLPAPAEVGGEVEPHDPELAGLAASVYPEGRLAESLGRALGLPQKDQGGRSLEEDSAYLGAGGLG